MDDKPVVANLEEFGTRVLNNVWSAVKNNFLNEVGVIVQVLLSIQKLRSNTGN